MATLPFDGKPLTIAIDQRHVVQLPARILRVRLTGMLFETDKTFLLPKAMHGIRGLVDLYEEHPDMDVVITGHTDRVGDPSYNLGLSDERARAIAAYLRDDVDTWVEWYSQHPFSRAWGTREDQHMLGAVIDDASGDPFYTGSVHGQLDAETQEAAKRFQASRGLTVDGIPGPQTRRALITSYMQLDGTTLPPNTNVTLYPNGQSVCALTFRLSRTSRGVRFTVDCECDWDRDLATFEATEGVALSLDIDAELAALHPGPLPEDR